MPASFLATKPLKKYLSVAFLIIISSLVLSIIPFQETYALSTGQVLSYHNNERSAHGLPPLRTNSKLNIAAANKSYDMIMHDYFAHTSPRGLTPWYWIRNSGYQYKQAGENLAIDFYDASQLHRAWMNSPSHRANILNSNYIDVGISVRSGQYQGRQTTIVVVMFGNPTSSSKSSYSRTSGNWSPPPEPPKPLSPTKLPQIILTDLQKIHQPDQTIIALQKFLTTATAKLLPPTSRPAPLTVGDAQGPPTD